ncbi:ClpP family protease [Leptospira kmetyi]|uniref:ATP-dependent Clp protease proteolytic subunit n=1 Tax=Leptospira kmetyi TaxID=408139 RepID=A0A2M9XQC6_9LEPT|nr:ATP-dependent Clp protease proteolytic subunit [Leptospira kmetyi]AYV55703.1 ATP-dependent Clp protease proteolytic subunit [Leptospira kmetyi]EQA52244.1 putative ATP-dependent Clp endopeptidase, proteolytic subunit ClpP [Leptospira kmetyi serovar Malaysia str. Bejo-Iso9]PJZ30189.1 ATP-dependent Clp protease proteolytic subunit [Leptospira kmetyi]PJZ41514.1 ATP-dependent Clp protease proteolytic subunit [Leptospira kmetyi]TGK16493.1 ATP-dependent Clp protease proteolytic subunit [Leptospira
MEATQIYSSPQIESVYLEQRKVFLWGEVNDNSARYLIDRFLYLEAVDPTRPISLYIHSPGGSTYAGLAILDVMNSVRPPVYTTCLGMAMSFGAVLLLCGDKGNRSAYPHSKILIHQPHVMGEFKGPAEDIRIFAESVKREKDLLNEIMANATGQPLDRIVQDTDRDSWFSAKEALKYGMIDKILGAGIEENESSNRF